MKLAIAFLVSTAFAVMAIGLGIQLLGDAGGLIGYVVALAMAIGLGWEAAE